MQKGLQKQPLHIFNSHVDHSKFTPMHQGLASWPSGRPALQKVRVKVNSSAGEPINVAFSKLPFTCYPRPCLTFS